jgi:hypothetical protein
LDEILEALNLPVVRVPLGQREAALDLSRPAILINKHLARLCHAQANLMGLEVGLKCHEMAHFRLHRVRLVRGYPMGAQQEEEAFTYQMTFLLPREMLREDPDCRELILCWQRREKMHYGQIKHHLEGIANRFRITRSAVAERLCRLNLLRRAQDGKSVAIAWRDENHGPRGGRVVDLNAYRQPLPGEDAAVNSKNPK